MTQFTVSWDAYKQNICSGLSTLQQNGEFVDMTLAADGHHVKVHQLIMALASPYIKELIGSTQCQHPVIFLNKISYATLCAILEYIYTGEVLVGKNNLPELVEAAKELHIKGLEDMKLELSNPDIISQSVIAKSNEGQPLSKTGFFRTTEGNTDDEGSHNLSTWAMKRNQQALVDLSHGEDDSHCIDTMDMEHDYEDTTPDKTSAEATKLPDTRIQYTISNQGALQMILNRCMYYLRYTSRKGPRGGHRQWKCIDYVRGATRCPATVITKDDVVVKRFSAHNHSFHDKQIMRKVRDQAVYSAIHDAEALGESRKQERQARPATTKNSKAKAPDTD